MPSRSSRRKSGSKLLPDLVSRLLQDGAVIASPSEELMAAGAALAEQGLLELQHREYVKCANHEDRDFSHTNRHCGGRIYLSSSDSHELRCPACERSVYPDSYGKRRFGELQTRVCKGGVLSHLRSLLPFEPTIKDVCEGVIRLDVGTDGVIVCVVDYCGDARFLSRERAAEQPSCFIAVNPRDYDAKFLDEEWIRRASLTDILCGRVDLARLVDEASTARPASVRRASIPVVANGPVRVVIEPVVTPSASRRFVVEVGDGIVRIEGVKVIAEQAGSRFVVFKSLVQWFLDDLRQELPPADFRSWTLEKLAEELHAQIDKEYEDLMSVRRIVNNLQSDIEKKLKQSLGLAIDREDIVQTCRWKGQNDGDFGYRVNPFTVAIRPFQRDVSQET